MRISRSAARKYTTCPRSYRYHYLDRLRERTASSFLAFGVAIDESLNAILRDLKDNKSVSVNYKDVFDEFWQTIKINGRIHNLASTTLVGYAKADFVLELLQEEDIRFIDAKIAELAPKYSGSDIKELKEFLDDKRSNRSIQLYTDEEAKLLNIINYLSLRRKGHLMLDAYVAQIVPQIEEVVAIQEKIELGSDDADISLVGYIDAIVKFKGFNEICIMDNKTSSTPYENTKVKIDDQLALYSWAKDLTHAAFAVMIKQVKLNKEKTCKSCGKIAEEGSRVQKCAVETIPGDKKSRCNGEFDVVCFPSVETQLLIDPISKEFQEVVMENLGEVAHAIQNNIFPRNLGTCGNVFGSVCPYLKQCHLGIDDENLEVVEESK